MGAMSFISKVSVSRFPRFEDAHADASEEAAFDYGHRQDSGTLAAKNSVQPFPRSLTDLSAEGLTARTIISALEQEEWPAEQFLTAFPALKDELRAAQATYDDKWGDAIGFRFGEHWYFVGLAPT